MSVVPISKKITDEQKQALAISNNIEIPMLLSFFSVESAGIGFSDVTGRMIIQFEPLWMKHFAGDASGKGTVWVNNGVCNQTLEYQAFEDACKTDTTAAKKSTSIGIGQIMGFHHKRLGFDTVYDMWDYADKSEMNQAQMVIAFIRSDATLYRAVQELDMPLIAGIYNGWGYKDLAKRLRIVPYDIQLQRAYDKFKSQIPIHKTTTSVNIRKGAGINFDMAGKPLPVNTPVEILLQTDGWAKIEVVATGLKGWVRNDFLK